MGDRVLEELTQELKELRIRENAVIETIERITESRRLSVEPQERNTPSIAYPVAEVASSDLRVGTRVRVKNKIRKPATAGNEWTERKERVGIVTEIRGDQVHFITENGTRTWRNPNNLEIIT